MYGFGPFACALNEIGPAERGLCPTDSRLRPDKNLMEAGDWDRADTVKVWKKRDVGVSFSPVLQVVIDAARGGAACAPARDGGPP